MTEDEYKSVRESVQRYEAAESRINDAEILMQDVESRLAKNERCMLEWMGSHGRSALPNGMGRDLMLLLIERCKEEIAAQRKIQAEIMLEY